MWRFNKLLRTKIYENFDFTLREGDETVGAQVDCRAAEAAMALWPQFDSDMFREGANLLFGFSITSNIYFFNLLIPSYFSSFYRDH